ncbi:MAG: Copper-exporting P-type ATPase [Planctomycetota bacterium]
MHREHDPHEWTSWTTQLFPKELEVNGLHAQEKGSDSENLRESSNSLTNSHHHNDHDHDDPVAMAEAQAARRRFQTRLAQILGLLILLEVAFWLIAPPFPTGGWYSPARWAAILGTIWSRHGVLENLLHGKIGADLALAQAALAALFLGEDFVAAEVVFISLIGEWLEDFAYQRARKAIGGLIENAPRIARILRDGEWQEIPAGSVRIGDRVAVEAGEIIPVDGPVLIGRSSVDASSLTGESLPVDVSVGDMVACGQINQFGRIEVRADRVGMESTLGQVVKLMSKAQSRKAQLERLADRYARYFLPAVETAALITLLAGFVMDWPDRWLRAVAVLVVACPCPLVLATPATILAGWAVLARRGVMVKSGAALEQLGLCDTLAFDKTGTLTLGQPDLTQFIVEENTLDESDHNFSREQIATLISTLEAHNPHPLASAVVRGLKVTDLTGYNLVESETFPSAGVAGLIQINDNPEPVRVLVGNLRLMNDHQLPLNEVSQQFLNDCDRAGETPLFVAVNQRLIAYMSLADQVRPEAHDTVHDLKHLGFSETAILTGDRQASANRVGKKVHIKNVIPELTAVQKADWIQERHVAGRSVVMVGDGINDAPALAVARVGIAVSKVGANLATEAGDIILMHDPLHSLVRARKVAQTAVRILRQNIFLFAFGLNGIAVLLAGLGVLNPVAAAIFHQAGSLAVLLNALRLLAFDHLQKDALSHRAEHLLEDLDNFIIRLLQRGAKAVPSGKMLILSSLLFMSLSYLCSGIRHVGFDEMLVRYRKGGQAKVISPGLYVGRPWPFEEIHRIKPWNWLSASLSDRQINPDTKPTEGSSWGNSSEQEDISEFWLTGDGQLLDIRASLQARVQVDDSNLIRIVRKFSDPSERIRAEIEHQLKNELAKRSLNEILSSDLKNQIKQVETQAMSRLAQEGLELSELKISIENVRPPGSVIDSWRDTARAERESERLELTTETRIQADQTQADSDIKTILDDARNRAEIVKNNAMANANQFRSLVKARKGRENLTDHRLFWSNLEKLMTDRSKILLDVPTGDLYGANSTKRHLVIPESPLFLRSSEFLDKRTSQVFEATDRPSDTRIETEQKP